MSEGLPFGVAGISHNHIYDQVDAMLGAGCQLKGFFGLEDDLASKFVERYPGPGGSRISER